MQGSLTCRKILHLADGSASPPKEGVLRIFIALKNPSLRPGEPANHPSNGKHADHYTPQRRLLDALFHIVTYQHALTD
jgi:hypothetical protein